jgi:hypothetical protein
MYKITIVDGLLKKISITLSRMKNLKSRLLLLKTLKPRKEENTFTVSKWEFPLDIIPTFGYDGS